MADYVGRCNRIDKCGYHYTPKQYFADTGNKQGNSYINTKPVHIIKQPKASFIPDEVFMQSLKSYEANTLIKFFHSIFNTDTVNSLINRYKIGTSFRYGGGTAVFWQIDIQGNVRAGKLIKYAKNGHRIHGKNNWVHSILKLQNFNLKQCLFGEHLLKDDDAPVAIVESEKTAIIASAFMPEMVWLATGGAENLNREKMKILRGRNVILFPDASKDGRIYQKWNQKAAEFGFNISDLLEKETTPEQKADGVDIADFLIKQKWNEWDKLPQATEPQEPTSPEQLELQPAQTPEPDKWDAEIAECEAYFKNASLPVGIVKLNAWTTITDARLFVESSLATVKNYNGNRYFLPYLNRLQEFINQLNTK